MNIGILGGGQLGRMLAMAGLPLGLHFTFLEPADRACAADVGYQIKRPYSDPAGLAQLCERSEVVTYEFENVPVDVACFIQARRPIFPPPEALRVAQDRLVEKTTFQELGIAVTRFAAVSSLHELHAAAESVGLPAILKTRRMGYDGKGQYMIRSAADVESAWNALGPDNFILEAFVPFKREISCLGVRSRTGNIAFYPVAENQHRAGILRVSIPRPDDPLQDLAEDYTRRILERLGYVGTLGFEFFDLGTGQLLGNEIAPRVHNSGHWSIEGSRCSQFENHIRAIAGLELGDTALRGPCAMVNFIGTAPSIKVLSRLPGVHPHLYGKTPRRRRKIGHATVTAADAETLQDRVQQLIALLPQED